MYTWWLVVVCWSLWQLSANARVQTVPASVNHMCQNADVSQNSTLYIGVVLPASNDKKHDFNRTANSQNMLQLYEAVKFAMDRVNLNSGYIDGRQISDSFVPGVKIGVIAFEPCGLRDTRHQLFRRPPISLSQVLHQCLNPSTRLLGIIVAGTKAEAEVTHQDMSEQCGDVYDLSDSSVAKVYTDQLTDTINNLPQWLSRYTVHLGWDSVIILYTADTRHVDRKVAISTAEILRQRGVCVSSLHHIRMSSRTTWPRLSGARIVILTSRNHMIPMLDQLSKQKDARRIRGIIASTLPDLSDKSRLRKLSRRLNVHYLSPYPLKVETFEDHWKSSHITREQNRWFTERLTRRSKCRFHNDIHDQDKQYDLPLCANTRMTEDTVDSLKRSKTVFEGTHSALTFANAIHSAWRAECGRTAGLCLKLRNLQPADFTRLYQQPLVFQHSAIGGRSPAELNGKGVGDGSLLYQRPGLIQFFIGRDGRLKAAERYAKSVKSLRDRIINPRRDCPVRRNNTRLSVLSSPYNSQPPHHTAKRPETVSYEQLPSSILSIANRIQVLSQDNAVVIPVMDVSRNDTRHLKVGSNIDNTSSVSQQSTISTNFNHEEYVDNLTLAGSRPHFIESGPTQYDISHQMSSHEKWNSVKEAYVPDIASDTNNITSSVHDLPEHIIQVPSDKIFTSKYVDKQVQIVKKEEISPNNEKTLFTAHSRKEKPQTRNSYGDLNELYESNGYKEEILNPVSRHNATIKSRFSALQETPVINRPISKVPQISQIHDDSNKQTELKLKHTNSKLHSSAKLIESIDDSTLISSSRMRENRVFQTALGSTRQYDHHRPEMTFLVILSMHESGRTSNTCSNILRPSQVYAWEAVKWTVANLSHNSGQRIQLQLVDSCGSTEIAYEKIRSRRRPLLVMHDLSAPGNNGLLDRIEAENVTTINLFQDGSYSDSYNKFRLKSFMNPDSEQNAIGEILRLLNLTKFKILYSPRFKRSQELLMSLFKSGDNCVESLLVNSANTSGTTWIRDSENTVLFVLLIEHRLLKHVISSLSSLKAEVYLVGGETMYKNFRLLQKEASHFSGGILLRPRRMPIHDLKAFLNNNWNDALQSVNDEDSTRQPSSNWLHQLRQQCGASCSHVSPALLSRVGRTVLTVLSAVHTLTARHCGTASAGICSRMYHQGKNLPGELNDILKTHNQHEMVNAKHLGLNFRQDGNTVAEFDLYNLRLMKTGENKHTTNFVKVGYYHEVNGVDFRIAPALIHYGKNWPIYGYYNCSINRTSTSHIDQHLHSESTKLTPDTFKLYSTQKHTAELKHSAVALNIDERSDVFPPKLSSYPRTEEHGTRNATQTVGLPNNERRYDKYMMNDSTLNRSDIIGHRDTTSSGFVADDRLSEEPQSYSLVSNSPTEADDQIEALLEHTLRNEPSFWQSSETTSSSHLLDTSTPAVRLQNATNNPSDRQHGGRNEAEIQPELHSQQASLSRQIYQFPTEWSRHGMVIVTDINEDSDLQCDPLRALAQAILALRTVFSAAPESTHSNSPGVIMVDMCARSEQTNDAVYTPKKSSESRDEMYGRRAIPLLAVIIMGDSVCIVIDPLANQTSLAHTCFPLYTQHQFHPPRHIEDKQTLNFTDWKRVYPSIQLEVRAILDVIRYLNGSYVRAVVHSNDEYGRSAAQYITVLARQRLICVSSIVSVSENASRADISTIYQNLKQHSDPSLVVLLLSRAVQFRSFFSTIDLMVPESTDVFIAGRYWNDNDLVSVNPGIDSMKNIPNNMRRSILISTSSKHGSLNHVPPSNHTKANAILGSSVDTFSQLWDDNYTNITPNCSSKLKNQTSTTNCLDHSQGSLKRKTTEIIGRVIALTSHNISAHCSPDGNIHCRSQAAKMLNDNIHNALTSRAMWSHINKLTFWSYIDSGVGPVYIGEYKNNVLTFGMNSRDERNGFLWAHNYKFQHCVSPECHKCGLFNSSPSLWYSNSEELFTDDPLSSPTVVAMLFVIATVFSTLITFSALICLLRTVFGAKGLCGKNDSSYSIITSCQILLAIALLGTINLLYLVPPLRFMLESRLQPPLTPAVCCIRILGTGIAYCTMYSGLLVKLISVWHVSSGRQNSSTSARGEACMSMAMISVQTVIAVFWLFISPLFTFSHSTQDVCSSDVNAQVEFLLSLSYCFVLKLLVLVFSAATWKCSQNGSRYIFVGVLMNITFWCLWVMTLIKPSAQYKGGATITVNLLCAAVTFSSVYLRKVMRFMYVWKGGGRENVTSEWDPNHMPNAATVSLFDSSFLMRVPGVRTPCSSTIQCLSHRMQENARIWRPVAECRSISKSMNFTMSSVNGDDNSESVSAMTDTTVTDICYQNTRHSARASLPALPPLPCFTAPSDSECVSELEDMDHYAVPALHRY